MKYTICLKLIFLFLSISCVQQENTISPSGKSNPSDRSFIGNTEDANTSTSPGVFLMGGSTDVDEAMLWMLDKANGGDIVVLRASGAYAYNPYLYNLADGKINSVQTLIINSRNLANDDDIINKVERAEAIFIAGGDQADYITFWSNTKLSRKLSNLIINKKIIIGGTSAGCAILGEFIFDALNGTVYSNEALNDPYIEYVSLQKNELFNIDILKNTITDTHYNNPNRLGRHIAFMARLSTDFNTQARGIGIQEETAVLIDENGIAKVVGNGGAYFLSSIDSILPEVLMQNQSLTWGKNKKAIQAIVIQNHKDEYINLTDWEDYNSSFIQHISVDNGILKIENK